VRVAEVLDEAEKRARRHRLIIILVVAGLIVAAFVVFGQLRHRALDDKADAATADLLPRWQDLDLVQLQKSYNDAAFDANDSGDYSAAIDVFPATNDASFITANFDQPGVVRAAYSVETWAGDECLNVVARGPVPNRVTFATRKGC
jgi:hypothetical protein